MSKKINIIHLIPTIGFGGGAENVVFNLCRTIDRSRFQITLLYWGEHQDLVEPIRATGAVVIKLPLKKVVSLDSVLKVCKAIRQAGGQMVHTHFMDADWLGFWAAKLLGIPLMLEVHSFPFPEHKRHAWRYRLMSGGVQRIICVSRKVKEHICQRTGIGENKFRVIYNGLDLQQFDRRIALADRASLRASFGVDEKMVLIGNVSRLIPDKGQEFLIKAMSAIVKEYPLVRLLIVGDGPLRGQLERLAESCGVRDHIVFAGKRTDVPELLKAMDVFVFPTFNEAFGICILEAMAAGKPIIATNDAAIPEIIADGKNGLLVHPGNAHELIDDLRIMLRDPDSRARLAAAARMRVQDFSMAVMTAMYENIYMELLEK